MCEAFGCTPSEAMQQDWALVRRILDYRNARTAVDVFNQGRKGVETMQRYPVLAQILVEMHRAQDATATAEGLIGEMGQGDGISG